MLKGQEVNQHELRIGFRQLADQNRFLFLQNQQLLDLNQELNHFKKERQEKAARKEAHVNRKRLPKRGPMNA